MYRRHDPIHSHVSFQYCKIHYIYAAVDVVVVVAAFG